MSTLPSGTEIEFGWNRSRGVIVSEDYRKARYYMSTGVYVSFNDPSIKVVGKEVEGYKTVGREQGEESWVYPDKGSNACEDKIKPTEIIKGIVLEFSGQYLYDHCKKKGDVGYGGDNERKAFFRTLMQGIVKDATYRLSFQDLIHMEFDKW